MHPRISFVLCSSVALLWAVSGCSPDYSPNTYSAAAVQQANKVEQGVIVGVRQVDVSAAGTVGVATGGAAGGIIGSQTSGGVGSAFGALGGALVGGLVGSAVEHSTADTTAFEYIVRKPNGDLLSVTQRDPAAMLLGQKVLLIDGKQARIVPDYTVSPPAGTAAASAAPLPKPAESTGVTSTVPPIARVDATPLAPPGSLPPGSSRPGAAPVDTAVPVVSPTIPPLAAPVPPPPLTPSLVPGAPTSLAPP